MSSSAPLTRIEPQRISSPSDPAQRPYAPQQPDPSSAEYSIQEPYLSQNQYPPPPHGQYPSSAQGPFPSQGQQYPPLGEPAPVPGIALQLGPESQIPDHPGSLINIPRPPAETFSPLAVSAPRDLRALRTSCQFNLGEYLSLQRKRQRLGASTSTLDLESRIRSQAGIVLGDLRMLQDEVRGLVKAAENHRWRKWLIGGAV